MVQDFSRPVLSAEDRAYLTNAAKPFKTARKTLEDLQAIGFDVSADLALADLAEQQRAGLLRQFGARRPNA